jgi:glycosyltransferase involved in cell wall biosynthesis
MTICFVIPTLTGGGAERVAVTVLGALDARHERWLYLFSRADGVYFDRIAPGVRVVVASKRRWIPRLVELAAFFRSSRPDVVMPFLSYFITAVAAWLAGSRAKVVFNQGTPTSGFLDDPDFSWSRPVRRRLFALVTRWFYRRADAIVATSRGVADDLTMRYGVPASKLHVLHNPVDLDAIAAGAREPLPPGFESVSSASSAADRSVSSVAGPSASSAAVPVNPRPVVVAAGRLARVKNYPLLIEAVGRLGGVNVWILGDGPERARLERLAKDACVGDRVTFWGFQANPWRFIARADVFALTSTYEGFGNVLVEAMACGTPVVATRSPGTTEIIEHERTGLLVDHEAAAVADAISRLLSDRALGSRLVAEARARVEHYAAPDVAARYERLFEGLAA